MPSAIQWTEETWNPVTGCTKVSPGCAHCYIERTPPFRIQGRRFELVDGASTTGVRLHPERLEQPLRWRRPRLVFVNSLSDLFHEEIPDQFIASVFDTMALAQHHTFQVLTKRPDRALDWLQSAQAKLFEARRRSNMGVGPAVPPQWQWPRWPLPNVWLGVSIENARYTWRADVLREIPAAVRFISAEPLLGSLLTVSPPRDVPSCSKTDAELEEGVDDFVIGPRRPLDLTGIDWLIAGGESGGQAARPMHPEWARELRNACLSGQCPHGGDEPCEDCVRSRPAFFFKQWGSWTPSTSIYDGLAKVVPQRWLDDRTLMLYAGPSSKAGGRLLDRRTWDEMPGQAVPA